jgi:acyl-CoA thioester hydrolase
MDHPRTLIHTSLIPIRWGDMDAIGHVNNTVYFRYMEQNRVEWFEAMKFGVGVQHNETPVIVNASCTFMIPFTYPGTVECRMYAGHPGRSSLPTTYELRLVGDDKLYAEGAAKIVWMNPATGKSVPLPEEILRVVRS